MDAAGHFMTVTNSFPLVSLSIRSAVKQKVNKINSLLTCISAEWSLDFYYAAGFLLPFIVLYKNLIQDYKVIGIVSIA